MAAQQLVEAVNEELCCSICMNRFRVPKMLDCTHSFCEKCLEEYAKKKNGIEMTCPICRKLFALPAGVKGLQTNIYLLNLCEKIDLYEKLKPSKTASSKTASCKCENCKRSTPVTAFCVDCKTAICKSCEEQHSLFAVLKTHSIVPTDTLDQNKLHKLKTSSAAPVCDLHPPEKMRFYCRSCLKLICRECIVILHPKPDHTCVEADSQFEDVKTTLSTFLGNGPAALNYVSKYMTKGESGVKLVKMESNALVKEMKDTYDKVKSSLLRQLDTQYKEAIDMVKDIQTSKESNINESVTSASNWCKRMENTMEITEKVLHENDKWELLGLSQNLIGSFQALSHEKSKFKWDTSDASLEMVFTPSNIPDIQFGKCFNINDLYMPTVVCNGKNTFYICFFDRNNSIIEVSSMQSSNQYSKEEFPPINLQQKDFEKAYKLYATTIQTMFILAVHQWLVVGFRGSTSFQFACKITEEASIIAICGCRNNLYVVYDSNPNTIYQLTYFNSYVSKARRAEDGCLNLRSVTNEYHGPIVSYTVTHKITNLVAINDMNTLVLINEAFELIQWDLANEYALDVKAPDQISNNLKMVAVLNARRSSNGTVRQIVITKEGVNRRISLENIVVFILWAANKRATMFEDTRDSDKRMFISQFETSTKSNSRVWEVSADMGIPRACQFDNWNNRLTVYNASGEVFNLQ